MKGDAANILTATLLATARPSASRAATLGRISAGKIFSTPGKSPYIPHVNRRSIRA